ncbi:MAG: response regulator [Planctomycetia bacterium]|nr:response regulator [Planctomycetia bacterium]
MLPDTVGRPMEILLVEDSLSDARLAIEALKEGRIIHRLSLVRHGTEAMEFLQQEGRFARAPRPDLVLLDLDLPGKDGREVLSEIKSDFELQHIPVVILTASRAHEDKLRGEMLHVDGYMVKPVELEKFLQLVRQLRRLWLDDVILPNVD